MTTCMAPICFGCAHLTKRDTLRDLRCAAFLGGIPQAIVDNTADHRFLIEGDHGIVFEPKTITDSAYASSIFDTETE